MYMNGRSTEQNSYVFIKNSVLEISKYSTKVAPYYRILLCAKNMNEIINEWEKKPRITACKHALIMDEDTAIAILATIYNNIGPHISTHLAKTLQSFLFHESHYKVRKHKLEE